MKTSESIDQWCKAFSLAQAEFKPALKDSNNPFFGKNYADFAASLEATREAYKKHGFSFIQGVSEGLGGKVVITRILHASSQWVETEYPLVCSNWNDPQKLGAATTYAKRYGYQAANGLSTEDDDGNSNVVAPNKTNTVKPSQTQRTQEPVRAQDTKETQPASFKTQEPSAPVNHSPTKASGISDAQRKRMFAMSKSLGWDEAKTKAFIREHAQVESSKDLTRDAYEYVTTMMQDMINRGSTKQATSAGNFN